MVKRYPHTAIVTIEANGRLVDGEWVSGKLVEISVPGRYDPVSDGRIILKHNSAGDEAQVHGYFYSKMQPPADSKFLIYRLSVGNLINHIQLSTYEKWHDSPIHF